MPMQSRRSLTDRHNIEGNWHHSQTNSVLVLKGNIFRKWNWTQNLSFQYKTIIPWKKAVTKGAGFSFTKNSRYNGSPDLFATLPVATRIKFNFKTLVPTCRAVKGTAPWHLQTHGQTLNCGATIASLWLLISSFIFKVLLFSGPEQMFSCLRELHFKFLKTSHSCSYQGCIIYCKSLSSKPKNECNVKMICFQSARIMSNGTY